MDKPGPLLVSIKTAARVLDLSEETVRRMITDGELDSTQVRRAVRIPWTSLTALVPGSRACCNGQHHEAS